MLDEYGEHHLGTGELILYTSSDSVLQLAAHVDVMSEPELYAVCEAAREVMTGAHAVGRVIARPFDGGPGAWHRRDGRRDFSLVPPARSYLQEIQSAGMPVHGVGKIRDLFAGVGVDAKHAGATNATAIAATSALLSELEAGMIFVNLVETDQVYGHRHDVEGFHHALQVIDAAVAQWLGCCARTICSCSPPTTAWTRTPTTPITRASTRRCWRASPATADGATTGPWPTSARALLRWLTGSDAPALPGTPFV